MTDTKINTQHSSEGFIDPRQARYCELARRQREIIGELRRLRLEMRVGICEVCGREFTRARVTKRVCSPLCTAKAYVNRQRKEVDVAILTEAYPLLRASGMLPQREVEILDCLVNGANRQTLAEEQGLSRQRIQQVLARAGQLAKIVLLVKRAAIGAGLAITNPATCDGPTSQRKTETAERHD